MIHCDYADDRNGTVDGLSGKEAVEAGAAYLFVTLGVPAIVGPAGSNDSLYAYPFAEEADAVEDEVLTEETTD